ncbi:MAG: DNA repair protein RecO [Candidatus Margulisbacteria bacterium]|nr:DNA repair protein RecO [Candidatus Margulisiibacteriota bacterium]
MKAVDEGIFLHRSSYSDSSLITTIYTRDKGLQKFVFRGGKKKGHQMYPLSVSELNYYGRTESELLNLTSAQAASNHSFQFNPVKSTIAFFIAETIRKCVIHNDLDTVTYNFLTSEINRLDTSEDCSLFPLEFMVSFTELLGFQPLVENEGLVFDLDEGIINFSNSRLNRTSEGEHIRLIVALITGRSTNDSVYRKTREKALETMISYYQIHIPRLKEFETYEIVREILSA